MTIFAPGSTPFGAVSKRTPNEYSRRRRNACHSGAGLAHAYRGTKLSRPEESAWVIWARLVEGVKPDQNRATLLVRGLMPVPDEAYHLRTSNRLTIRSTGWVPAFAVADRDGSVPLFVHTHPDADTELSDLDRIVDDELARVASVRNTLEGYGSVIISGSSDQPMFTGRLHFPDSGWRDIGRLRVAGRRLHLLWPPAIETAEGRTDPPVFDRQIRAFGTEGQATLERLRVGIVGAGGTGSAIAEQLIRLGVGELTVIDSQDLDGSNVTRVYGSTLQDEGKPKAKLVSKNAHRIGLGTIIKHYKSSVTVEATAKRLVHCDVIFGCTDDHAGRAVLTRMPLSLLQLLIDCGVLLDSNAGILIGIYGRISVVAPGDPCLVCHGDVNPDRLRDEMLPPQELIARKAAGNAPELDEADPAVIPYTTMAAAAALNELLGRLFGFTAEGNHLLLLPHERRMSPQHRDRVGTHRCGDTSKSAAGLAAPFLDWSWGTAS